MKFLKTHLPETLLVLCMILYSIFFTYFTITKMHYLYANYFDLGIMHQTTFNTYKAITNLDFSRVLEMTDPYGPNQLKRMAIHNDMILALLAPFYFIYSGAEMLLVIQTVVLALGAWGLYLVTRHVFGKQKYARWFGAVFGISYLFYPAMQNANIFEFHAVTLATTFLIYMFYFWLKKRYGWSFLFLALSLLTKEQLGLTTAFFGFYTAFVAFREDSFKFTSARKYLYPVIVIIVSLVWFFFTLKYIIPMSRGGTEHFALDYYGDFGSSPEDVVFSVLKQPTKALEYVFKEDALQYLLRLFQPVGFLAFLAPLTLGIASPEFGVNLISNNGNMRLIIYHYTSVLTPFIFLAAIYAVAWIVRKLEKRFNARSVSWLILSYLVINALMGSYFFSSMPYAKQGERYIFSHPFSNRFEVMRWAEKLKDDSIKVSSTGKLAPFFTSRRYYYVLSDRYKLADYVVLNPQEVFVDYGNEYAIPAFEALQNDPNFQKIYDKDNLQVYKKINKPQ